MTLVTRTKKQRTTNNGCLMKITTHLPIQRVDLSTDSTNRRFVERSRRFTTLRVDKLVEESSTGQAVTISSGAFYRPAVSGISDGEGTGGGGMTGQSVCRFCRHPKT